MFYTKKINYTFLFLSALLSSAAEAQSLGVCGKSHTPSVLDGSGSLGLIYNNSQCALNYTQASQMTQTRTQPWGFNMNGTGFPTTLLLNGLPASYNVLQAYIWYIASYTSVSAPSSSIDITDPAGNSANVFSSIAGLGPPKCWGETGTAVYKADVTNFINGNGFYSIDIFGFTNPDTEVDGVTLFVIYTDSFPTTAYEGTLLICDGNITSSSGANNNQSISGFTASANSSYADAFIIVSDMQANLNAGQHSSTLNSATANYPNIFYNFDVTTTGVTAGQNTANFGTDAFSNDCYTWAVMGLYYQTASCGNAISEADNDFSISVFPNPSDGIFQIINPHLKIIEAEITNVLGERIAISTQRTGNSPHGYSLIPVDLSSHPDGVYFLTIKTSQGTATKKLILQK